MKFKLILPVILLACLLISCKQSEDPADTTAWTMAPFKPESVSFNLEDLDVMRELHAQWRISGNPDYFESAVTHELTDPEGEISYTLQEVYTTQDETWQVQINVLKNRSLKDWTHMPSLEKYENGEWVRQTILWDEKTYYMNPRTYAQRGLEYFTTNPITRRALQIPVADIFPEPSPGQYRFVLYMEIVLDHVAENGMYYIPFEVVE